MDNPFERARRDCAAEVKALKEAAGALALAACDRCDDSVGRPDRHGLLVVLDVFTNYTRHFAGYLEEAGADALRHCAASLYRKADEMDAQAREVEH